MIFYSSEQRCTYQYRINKILVNHSQSIICIENSFLIVQPIVETHMLADQLTYDVDVYVMIDDNNSKFSSLGVPLNFQSFSTSNK
jgi:hypothetical protein